MSDFMLRRGQEVRLRGLNTRRIGAEIPVGKTRIELHGPAPRGESGLQGVRSQGPEFASTLDRVQPGLISAGIEAARSTNANCPPEWLAGREYENRVGRDRKVAELGRRVGARVGEHGRPSVAKARIGNDRGQAVADSRLQNISGRRQQTLPIRVARKKPGVVSIIDLNANARR